jgi:hypothetical protein
MLIYRASLLLIHSLAGTVQDCVLPDGECIRLYCVVGLLLPSVCDIG